MKNLILLLFVGACFAYSSSVLAEDIEMVNRPVNSSGLTGLLFTTAPYTLAPGVIEVGISVQSESSNTPDYTITEYPLSVTFGLPHNSELAIRGSYYSISEGPTLTTPIERTSGSIELSYKWNFFPPVEDSPRPAVALFLTGIAPLENNSDSRVTGVSHWGMRIGISLGTEISWKEHILGIYADGQLAGQDVTESRLRDIYEIINGGMIFPISKYQNLQMLIEYSIVRGKAKLTIDGGDYTAITYGLRLVSERFNVTLGTQFLRKDVQGFDNSNRVIGLASMKF